MYAVWNITGKKKKSSSIQKCPQIFIFNGKRKVINKCLSQYLSKSLIFLMALKIDGFGLFIKDIWNQEIVRSFPWQWKSIQNALFLKEGEKEMSFHDLVYCSGIQSSIYNKQLKNSVKCFISPLNYHNT